MGACFTKPKEKHFNERPVIHVYADFNPYNSRETNKDKFI